MILETNSSNARTTRSLTIAPGKKFRFLVVVVSAMLTFPVLAHAGTIYVDGTSGSDTNDGLSEDLAVATITHGATLLASGGHDQMVVAEGTYYETPLFEGLTSSAEHPVWIRAAVPGTVTISGMWEKAALGQVTWEDESGGVYSAEHNPVLYGAWNGVFLFLFNSVDDLRDGRALRTDPDTEEVLVDLAMPPYGIAVEGERVYVKLPDGQPPTGEDILLSAPGWDKAGELQGVVEISGSPHVIFDGFRVEGSGTNCVFFSPDSIGATVRNTVLSYCRQAIRLPSYSLVEWSEYTYPGFHDFAEEVRKLNSPKPGIAAIFDLVKVYHQPVLMEGCLAESYWNEPTSHHCEFRYNFMHEAFDGERLGVFNDSESHHSVYLYNYDNHIELKAWSGFDSAELRVHDSLFLACPMGIFSHYSETITGPQYIYRNVVHFLDDHGHGWTQLKSLAPNTPTGSIHIYHNLIWGGDTLLFYKSHGAFTLRNNIFVFSHNQDEEPVDWPPNSDYNILVNDLPKKWIQGEHGIFLDDPTKVHFLDAPNLDFGIGALSPARNSGVSIDTFNEDAPGGPDIGPFEFENPPGPDWPRPMETTFTCDPPENWQGPLPDLECGQPPDIQEYVEIVEQAGPVEYAEVVEQADITHYAEIVEQADIDGFSDAVAQPEMVEFTGATEIIHDLGKPAEIISLPDSGNGGPDMAEALTASNDVLVDNGGPMSDSGCGCDMAGKPSPQWLVWLLFFLLPTTLWLHQTRFIQQCAVCKHLLRLPICQQHSILQHQRTGADLPHKIEIVGGDDAGVLEVLKQLDKLPATARVEVGTRFIKD